MSEPTNGETEKKKSILTEPRFGAQVIIADGKKTNSWCVTQLIRKPGQKEYAVDTSNKRPHLKWVHRDKPDSDAKLNAAIRSALLGGL
jgi:heterodisulfide reductase subunit A-like polyferredoxin